MLLDGRTVRAVGLPIPRSPANKLILLWIDDRLSDDFHILSVLLGGLPGPSGHRTASRHSLIDSNRSAFTRRVLTP